MSTRGGSEREKRVQEKHFQLFLDNTVGMIFIVGANGILCYESPACLRILGYEETHLAGQNFLTLVHPQDAVAVQALFSEACLHPGNNGVVRCRVRHPQWAWCRLSVTATGFSDEKGIVHVILRCYEMTQLSTEESQRAEQEKHDDTSDALLRVPNRELFVDGL